MNANHIYEERKEVSILIKKLLIKINKKLKNLGVFNVEKENISIHHMLLTKLIRCFCVAKDMNSIFELVNKLKNNERLMNHLKANDEEFFNELNIKHSFLIFYNNMFYSDIEHLITKKIEVYNSKNSIGV